MEELKPDITHRVKGYFVPMEDMLESLVWIKHTHFRATMYDLPADFLVLGVNYLPKRHGFLFTIASNDFDVVAPENKMPMVNDFSKEIMEINLEKTDHSEFKLIECP